MCLGMCMSPVYPQKPVRLSDRSPGTGVVVSCLMSVTGTKPWSSVSSMSS